MQIEPPGPHRIVLRAPVPAVTVHTNIAYSSVDASTVELTTESGVSFTPYTTFADDRGNLVAKFRMCDVREAVAPPSAYFTLSGATKTGAEFQGSETVEVKGH